MRIKILSTLVLTALLSGCGNPTTPTETSQQSGSKPTTPQDKSKESSTAPKGNTKASGTAQKGAEQHGPGRGMGRGMGGPGRGMGRGMGRGGGFRPDMTTIHAMFAAKEKIKRTVKALPTGAEAVTESDDPEITSLIQEHVPAMETRVMENSPLPPMTFHPVFQGLIKHADDYTLEFEDTDKGIKVTYKAEDPYVIMLVQEHSKLVSRFLKNGMSEIHKPYELPKHPAAASADAPKYINPAIQKFGKVLQLKEAAQQPRDGSRIVVDITQGDDPEKMNSAIEKVCRFVNIYAGAGSKPAKVDIAIVIHGSATLSVLKSDAYAKRFNVDENPTLEVLGELREAGVKVYVCGQSLIGKGATTNDVSEHVEVAVSALTSLVNLQSDGYSLLPF